MRVRARVRDKRGTRGQRVRELGRNHVAEDSLKVKRANSSTQMLPVVTPPWPLPAHRNALSAAGSASDDPDTKAGVVEATDASFGTPIAIVARS